MQGRVLSGYVTVLMVLSLTLAAAVTFGAGWIAGAMGDPLLTEPLRWMGLPFLFLPFLSVLRGYFQSRHKVAPTAVTQVVEQFVRVGVILLAAWIGMQAGNVYTAGRSAGIGAAAGGAAGTVVMLLYARRSGLRFGWVRPDLAPDRIRRLLVQGLFVSAAAMLLLVMQVIDAFTMPERLGEQAAAQKGVYDRSWPLLQFGALVTTVFAYASLPLVTKAWERGDREEAAMYATAAVRFCLVFGSAAAAGLAAVMPAANPAMFQTPDGTGVLQGMAFIAAAGSLYMTGAALLHAVGSAGTAAAVLGGAALIKLAGNLLLVPVYGTAGAAAAGALAAGTAALIVLWQLAMKGLFRMPDRRFIGKLGVSLLVMSAAAYLFTAGGTTLTDGRLMAAAWTGTGTAAGAACFILLIHRNRLFTEKEWEQLPKLPKLLPYRSSG